MFGCRHPFKTEPRKVTIRGDVTSGKGAAVRGLTYRRRARRLDHELADGFDPEGDRHRRRRAHAITATSFRRDLAARLERLVHEADGSPPWQSPVRWPEVRACSILILALAESLAAPTRVSAQGVARVVVLLDDGDSALFGARDEGALSVALKSALRGLELGPRLRADRTALAPAASAPMPWGI
jgi:hypothetical protein